MLEYGELSAWEGKEKNKNIPLLYFISRRKKCCRVFSIGLLSKRNTLQSLAEWWNQNKVCILIETKSI